jgi:aryl-alcohol dehydrogenase-like predicted oxidoreductase|tara:strand:- start:624 stop:824 length:201 start_codon:yes stop_codon:yes gene_type:complete
MIKKRKLGKSDLYVSEIGLGGWQLGAPVQINNKPGTSFGGLDEDIAYRIIGKKDFQKWVRVYTRIK